MTLRLICPRCHSPLDPRTMDAASTANARLRICPDCDEPIVLAVTTRPGRAAVAAIPSQAPLAGNGAR